MGHLSKCRLGWTAEHLALYILSKISFVSQPVTIADDLGTDFFCSLFDRRGDELHPTSSFAIQIKRSSKKRFELTKHIDYLYDLEVPFFIGLIDGDNLTVSIYSGEALVHFFSMKGDPTNFYKDNPNSKVFVKVIKAKVAESLEPYIHRHDDFEINFPHILDLHADNCAVSVPALKEECRKLNGNITSFKNNEFLFTPFLKNSNEWLVYSGPGSANTFRDNFYKRLGEVYANLALHGGSIKELEAYDKVYEVLSSAVDDMPGQVTYLFQKYKDARKR